MTGPRRILAATVALAAAVSFVGIDQAGIASAYWTSSTTGSATAATDTLLAGNQPTTTVGSTATVTLNWAATTTQAGHPASGYKIARYSSASSGTPVAATGGCASVVTALTCTEQSVPAGTWYYSVTPVVGGWSGPESPRSSATTVAVTTLTFMSASAYPGGSLTGGSLSGFAATENVTFRLDSPTGTVLTTSPSPVTTTASGSATGISVTLPGSLTPGSTHSVYAIGATSGAQAAATITVTQDTSSPNAPSITFPSSGGSYNATGWTGTLTGTASDNTGGSGVARTEVAISNSAGQYWNGTTFTATTTTWLTTTGANSNTTWSYQLARPADGGYTVQARTIDNQNNTGTAANSTFSIDATAPNAPSITFPSSGGDYNAAGWTGTLAGTASDNTGGSGIARTEVAISNVAGQYWNGVTFTGTTTTWLPINGASNNASWSYPLARPADGSYTVQARSIDNLNNIGTATSSTFSIDTIGPKVTSVTLANGGGAAGTADAGDSVTVTFSETMDATTFCSSWTNTGSTQTLTGATADLQNAGQNDTVGNVNVTVQTGCGGSLAFGTVNTGGNYLNGQPATFSNSTVAWNPTTRALTLTLGTVTSGAGGLQTGVTPGRATGYTEPATGLKDLAGNYPTGDTSTTHTYTFSSTGVATAGF